MNDLKVYRVTIDSDCYAISLVEEGAIESDFIALSKQQYEIKMEDEKRLLIGAALIPDKLIYRYMYGKEFYISFDSETIEKLAQDFIANHRQNNITADHNETVDDVVIVESWIKTSESDKSVSYGLNEPIGTWFIAMKINNDEIWNKVKNGEYKGFSIEAIVDLDEIINNNIKMSMDKEFIDKLKEIIYEAMGKTPDADKVVEETVEEVIEKTDGVIELDAKDEEIAKLKEDVSNLVAEVERLKSERDELESKLQDAQSEKDKKEKEIEEVRTEMAKMSKQPSIEPARAEQTVGKNYNAAIKFMLK